MKPNPPKELGLPVSRETQEKIDAFVGMLCDEASAQNLIAASTVASLWERHIRDSAQLTRFASPDRSWVDIGSGAGLPGVMVALLTKSPVLLIEPRRLRAEFLTRVIAELQLGNAQVLMSKAEQASGRFDVITARAVAPLAKLLGITSHLAHAKTLWVLPKGRNAKSELAEAERSWHYDLRAEPSCTDPEASILLLSKVRAKR